MHRRTDPFKLRRSLLSFLEKSFSVGDKVLLGLSGGCDSLALFHLLLECLKHFPLHLGVAHVDHQWRAASAEEARQLEVLVTSNRLPFHLCTLSPEENASNLEAKCREKRIAFFKTLCTEHGYRGVLLAHHGNDQAETILKNILEGTNLFSKKGIAEHTQIGPLHVWRPLLGIPKSTLSCYLEEKGITPFLDETNFDTRFLRGRMRTEILPYLESLFGKEIHNNLILLGQEEEELYEFMRERHARTLDTIISGPLGMRLDLSCIEPLHPLDLKFLLRTLCKRAGRTPSKACINAIIEAWNKEAANKMFPIENSCLYLDRRHLFLVPAPFPDVWEMELVCEEQQRSDWRSFFQGFFIAELPADAGPYQIAPAIIKRPYAHKSEIGDWWSAHKVPAFLRRMIPVVWRGDEIVHEFLTGKASPLWQREPCAKKICVLLRPRETPP